MWRDMIKNLRPDSTFSLPATLDQIEDVEQTLKVALPDDLRLLLRESDGVSDQYGSGLIWATMQIKKQNVQFRTTPEFKELYMPFDSLLFFADAGNFDQFAFCITDGRIRSPKVFAWNNEDDSRTWVASSLETYLEWWLQGRIGLR